MRGDADKRGLPPTPAWYPARVAEQCSRVCELTVFDASVGQEVGLWLWPLSADQEDDEAYPTMCVAHALAARESRFLRGKSRFVSSMSLCV